MTSADLSPSPPADEAAAERAQISAQAAAQASGVDIGEVETIQGLEEVSGLLCTIWNRDPKSPQVTPDLLRALSMTGNYVAGASLQGRLIGAAVGFFADPLTLSVHSHIAGVSRSVQAKGVGYALKLHQRAWALSHGASTITWTFDPLVRRNAYLNIARLGARPVEYLPNFYGEMHDSVNGGQQSDRLFVEWRLLDGDVIALCDGLEPKAPVVHETAPSSALVETVDGRPERLPGHRARSLISVPADIERMRIENPDLARDWRMAVREELGGAMARGGRIVNFLRGDGYVVESDEHAE